MIQIINQIEEYLNTPTVELKVLIKAINKTYKMNLTEKDFITLK